MQLLLNLRAEFIKIRRTPLFFIHLVVPLLGAAGMIWYYFSSPIPALTKALGFLQLLCAAFPLLIGIVCALSAEQEHMAGQFQNMLGASHRSSAFWSKFFLLVLLGLGASLLAVCSFGAWLGPVGADGLSFYPIAGGILLISNLFLYGWHLFLSLKFGSGPSIGAGVVESMLAVLCLSDLLGPAARFLPPAWCCHFSTVWTNLSAAPLSSPENEELLLSLVIAAGMTLLLFLSVGVWFSRWDGRRSDN